MQTQESMISSKSFAETQEYLQTIFFRKLRPFVPNWGNWDENENPRTDGVLPFPPLVEVDEPKRFTIVKGVGARMSVRIGVEEDDLARVWVTCESEADLKKNIVSGIVVTVLTCGLGAFLFGPHICFRYFKCRKYAQDVVELLKADLVSN
jgi:hypothetical protein